MKSLFGNTSLVGLLFYTLLVSGLDALVVRNYSATSHDRFTGFPSAPVHNASFIHAAYDFTGVGWDTGNTARQLTMVSPLHFVGANHYKPGVGAIIRFVASDGSIKDYTVASQVEITNDDDVASDLFYGTLSSPIPESDQVGFHPFLNLSSESRYRRKNLIILGKTARGGSEQISIITSISSATTNSTRALRWNYNISSGSNNDAYLQIGDSGSPVFIDQNGVAAIVGTNSVVSTSSSTIYNYSNFIPHYADKLDTGMADQGYHMTRAIPGSTTLSLTHTPPNSIIRAGHDFTINLSLNNIGGTLADNVKLQNTFPTSSVVSSASGTDWFDESTISVTRARRAYLASSASTNYSITLNIPDAGQPQHQVTYGCDQFPLATENFNLSVIESFISWSSSLTDQSAEGDDDQDGINNLLEYAFGGDASTGSQKHPNSQVSLLPHFANNTLSYIRRTDATTRALTYQLKSSTTLESDSWSDASSLVSQTSTSPIDTNFEVVTHTLTQSGTERFFRIEVTLSE